MKSALPQYQLRKCWLNNLNLQRIGLSYTAIGVYVCATTNKLNGFSSEDLALASIPNTLSEIEYALEIGYVSINGWSICYITDEGESTLDTEVD